MSEGTAGDTIMLREEIVNQEEVLPLLALYE